MAAPPSFTVKRLQWQDEELGSIPLPRAPLQLTRSFGSGLARRVSDPAGHVWAVGDRGPNLKIETMLERYGAAHLARHSDLPGAKVMPRPDVGPAIARLQIGPDRVELVEMLEITDSRGRPVSGLPMPGTAHALSEPALTLEGDPIAPDPSGLDSEGLVALADGTFILSDEFGPSLLRLDDRARVLGRYLPAGITLAGARYPVHQTLPAIAGKRQLNRGFEAIAHSPDEQSLFVAFQSPLAHPDEQAHEQARHVRLWRIDIATMTVTAQFLYPLDPPETFLRDRAEGPLAWRDLKISELLSLPGGGLLALERGSHTTKIYRIEPDAGSALAPEHLDIATSPTVEQLSANGTPPPCLNKQLVFTSDGAPDCSRDLEGMTLLSPTELLLVNDSDFGTEGVTTAFWKLSFAQPQFD